MEPKNSGAKGRGKTQIHSKSNCRTPKRRFYNEENWEEKENQGEAASALCLKKGKGQTWTSASPRN